MQHHHDLHREVLSSNVRLCNSLWKKATGLMFRWPDPDFAFIFHFRRNRFISVTMLFVFYPIDVLFLDQHGVVVEMKSRLKPFRHYHTLEKARTFIELPVGTIKAEGIRIGSKLHWTSKHLYRHSSFYR
ncbi:MAG: DUF192 domain-containing protein [Nanobdellota archaeon]